MAISGAGVNSQAGIQLGSNQEWVENEGMRWVRELGILGFMLMIARTVLPLVALYKLQRIREPLLRVRGLILIFLFMPSVFSGQLNPQATVGGGLAIFAGLVPWYAKAGHQIRETT
ncbi:hypothetical protein Kisp01_27480 [Kineosporia sp. NBRC 101677]|nr:hypothetical protein Kisp01_27480 [Kineosporia sp. NBRC 101677]